MSAILVEGLGKRYVIGHQVRVDTLRDALSHRARGLWQALRARRAARRTSREEFWALRDVSFGIEPGEVVGIIGRNGAGKSTLLKILSRITEPTTGSVTLRGRVASLLEVGTGFHPELSGRENIYLNGAILGMTRAEIRRKFDEIVAFAEVERFLDTPVKRYSSGMYVRLAFAVAAHLEPEILIVDEVLAVGDAEFQKKCLAKMQAIATGTGRTILFVSHNLGAVHALCPSSILLEGGRTRGVEPTREATLRYLKGQPDLRAAAGGATGVRLAHLQIAGAAGRALELESGQPACLELQLLAARALNAVTLTIAFTDAEGHRVFALTSADSAGRLSLPAGTSSFQVALDLPSLFPGAFALDVGVYDATGAALLEAYGAAHVHVRAHRDGPDRAARPGFGVVSVASRWTPQSNPSPDAAVTTR